jgi:hypothetical protein
MSQGHDEHRVSGGSPHDRLIALLAGYLTGCPRARWPGADGLTVADVVRARYPAAAVAGLVPDLDELARRHPDLAEAIARLFPAGGAAGRNESGGPTGRPDRPS